MAGSAGSSDRRRTSLADQGVGYVIKFEKRRGREAVDVSHNRRFVGYDVISVEPQGSDHRTIEVKASKQPLPDIPDAFETQFTRTMRFVPTHLYVVMFGKDGRTVQSLHVIPKEEIDDHALEHRQVMGIKFASALKKKLREGKFRIRDSERP